MTNLGGTGVSENTDFDDEITALFDRQDRLNPLTLAAWQADPRAQLDDVVTTAERSAGNGGGGTGDVIASGTENDLEIVKHNNLPLSWELRQGDIIKTVQYDPPKDGTDAQPVLQAAIDFAGVGGSVQFENGVTYALGNRLTPFAEMLMDGNGCKLVSIPGIDIATQGFNPIGNVAFGPVVVRNCDGVEIKNFELDGTVLAWDVGVEIFSSSRIKIHHNYIHNIGTKLGAPLERGNGIVVQGENASDIVTDLQVYNNIIHDIEAIGNRAGDFIYSRFADRVIIRNNQCKGCHRMGIALTDNISNVIITGNNLSDISAAGIDLETNTKASDLNRTVISNNTITRFGKKPAGETGSQFYGIDFHDTAENITVTGNIISFGDPDSIGNSTRAFSGVNGARDVIISGNVITDVDEVMVNFIGASMQKFVFSNNVARNIRDRGLFLSLATECVITGNIINSALDPININGGGKCLIGNNHLTSGTTQCIAIQQETTATITGNILIPSSVPGGGDSAIFISNTSNTIGEGVISGNIIDGVDGATKGILFSRQTGGEQRYIVRDNLYINGITTRTAGYITTSQQDAGGVQVHSPDGTEFIIKVDNAGVITSQLA